jgi:RNA polymerase sigma-70 factor, ECF subfamily
MEPLQACTDQELLTATDRPQDAFATFYRRHLPTVLAFVMHRVRNPELAADLTAEVFAVALVRRTTFDETRGVARAWLCTIAANKIVDSLRRGQVEDEYRRRLGMAPLQLEDQDLRRIEEMVTASSVVGDLETLLSALPVDTRAAVESRVLEERPYAEIASRLRCSESVVRKRVSRGLRQLRMRMTENL